MGQRGVVAVAMVALGALVLWRYRVVGRLGTYLEHIGQADQEALRLSTEAGKWLLGWLLLWLILTAMTELGRDTATLAAILAGVIVVSAWYRLAPLGQIGDD